LSHELLPDHGMAESTKKQYISAIKLMEKEDIAFPYTLENCMKLLQVGKTRNWKKNTFNTYINTISKVTNFKQTENFTKHPTFVSEFKEHIMCL
jgi:hypothetical protein